MNKGSHHTAESNEKNRIAHLGKTLSPEHITKVIEASNQSGADEEVQRRKSNTLKMFYSSPDGIALRARFSQQRLGNRNAKGYRHTEDAKVRMSASRMGQAHMLGHHQTDEVRTKVSKATKGVANPMYGKKHPKAVRMKMSRMGKQRWLNPIYRDRQRRVMQLAQHIRPTEPERIVFNILETIVPSDWKYTGDGEVIICGRNPDFTNVNGHKSCILLHGIYWHLWRKQKDNPELTKEQVEQEDINFYRTYGWDCLIVWEDELKDTEAVKAKIDEFVGGR